MIEPFFFRQELLFGCYHPSAYLDSQRLMVVSPPLFDEYRRSYRALSDLANACSEQGVHVLRFDYYGTGESYGELNQSSIGVWKGDVEAAIEEGIALSGANEVTLLGVRFGGLLNSQIRHPSIKRYIFWDPVDSGASYLGWLDEVNHILKEQHQQSAKDINIPFENIEYENFKLPPKLKKEMAALTFDFGSIEEISQPFIITTDPSVYDSKKYANCEFPMLRYDWPAYHDGLISLKPVLEAIARRVLAS